MADQNGPMMMCIGDMDQKYEDAVADKLSRQSIKGVAVDLTMEGIKEQKIQLVRKV